jgi:hypothetical protein
MKEFSIFIQKHNMIFAKALDKGLMDIAKEKDDTVSIMKQQ